MMRRLAAVALAFATLLVGCAPDPYDHRIHDTLMYSEAYLLPVMIGAELAGDHLVLRSGYGMTTLETSTLGTSSLGTSTLADEVLLAWPEEAGNVERVMVSPSGRHVALDNIDGLFLWDLKTPEVYYGADGPNSELGFDLRELLYVDENIVMGRDRWAQDSEDAWVKINWRTLEEIRGGPDLPALVWHPTPLANGQVVVDTRAGLIAVNAATGFDHNPVPNPFSPLDIHDIVAIGGSAFVVQVGEAIWLFETPTSDPEFVGTIVPTTRGISALRVDEHLLITARTQRHLNLFERTDDGSWYKSVRHPASVDRWGPRRLFAVTSGPDDTILIVSEPETEAGMVEQWTLEELYNYFD